MNKLTSYFSKVEWLIFCLSTISIIISHFIFNKENYLVLIASLIGVTSLIFAAKGNPISQVLMIVFSITYGIISYSFNYYGEMITYLGMTMPMAIFALVSWLKHPYKNKKSEVEVNNIEKSDLFLMIVLTIIVTVVFYFILKHLNTANLGFSTVSVTTSFAAVFLTFKRSPYFALAYALNDIVLIILWILASFENVSYISVVVCFLAFLVNDIYGFISWCKMQKRQQKSESF
ncbi:MAG: nicotinamide mononucleotide transporter [Clostridia bacterium]|nr:nicotinamide mononucleotide transporter [Clostridia bacterium]